MQFKNIQQIEVKAPKATIDLDCGCQDQTIDHILPTENLPKDPKIKTSKTFTLKPDIFSAAKLDIAVGVRTKRTGQKDPKNQDLKIMIGLDYGRHDQMTS